MSFLDRLAKMVGVRGDQAEDALQDEGRARQAVKLSRRGFFAAGATMASAPLVPKRAYSFIFDTPDSPWEMWSLKGHLLLPYAMLSIIKDTQAVKESPVLSDLCGRADAELQKLPAFEFAWEKIG